MTRMFTRLQTLICFCLLLIATALSNQSFAFSEFLKADQAFRTNVQVNEGLIQVSWSIAPGYYLYKKSLSLEVIGDHNANDFTLHPGQIAPEGQLKQDEFMGNVYVHYDNVQLTHEYSANTELKVELVANYQGCAEDGICYPPTSHREQVTLPASSASAEALVMDNAAQSVDTSSDTGFATADIAERPLWLSLLLYFGLGLLLSMTPCVLPMVPILSGIILGTQRQKLSTARGFGLSVSYVLGMALVYTGIGLLIALSGARLQIYMQHPYILWPLAGAFVILALALFGAFELRLPQSLGNKLHDVQGKIPGGRFASVFLIGALSAVVVSPCISAPLAGILLYIAQAGKVLEGGLSLFVLALGMGAPLIVLGTTGANILPKAGLWMNHVKVFFGFMMLLMAIYMVKHLLSPLVLYGLLAVIAAWIGLWLGALRTLETSISALLGKAIGLCLLFIASLLLLNAWQQIFPSTGSAKQIPQEKVEMQRVTSISSLEAALASAKAQNKQAMVDVYADWCVACIELEYKTFIQPEIRKRLNELALIRLDITDTSGANQILDHLDIIGPPTLMFYDQQGVERQDLRVTGFVTSDEFMPTLDALKALRQTAEGFQE